MRPGDVRLGERRARPAWPPPAARPWQAAARPTMKWPGRWSRRMTASVRAAISHELGVTDELQVAARLRRDHTAPVLDQSQQLRDGLARCRRCSRCAASALCTRELGVDRAQEIAGDAGDDLRQLDRLGDVVDEVDENGEVDQQKASATVIDRCGTKSPGDNRTRASRAPSRRRCRRRCRA